jgi:hypothetical protein
LLSRPGRAIGQAFIRRLTTAAARIQARVKSCGTCGEQGCTGARTTRANIAEGSILQKKELLLILEKKNNGDSHNDAANSIQFNSIQFNSMQCNSIQFFIIYAPSQQLQGQLQTQHSTDIHRYRE